MELAVGASESAMSSLLGKLGSLLAQEYTLISGVRSEIQYMNDELASMHAFLRKLGRAAGSGAAHDEQTKDWIEQVRDVAYDIEDCIDDFAHRLGHQPRGEGLLVSLRRAWYTMTTLWSRRDIAAQIIDLKNRAQDVGERRSRYGVQDPNHDANGRPSGTTTPRPYRTEHQPPAPQLVGTTNPVGQEEAIAKHGQWLTEPQAQGELRVLAVVGFGGLGKTTMALELLRRFGERFDYRAFVQASQKLNLPSLLSTILKQVTPHKELERKTHGGSSALENGTNGTQRWSVQQLKQKLDTQLQQKRFFLIVDDVWSVSSWKNIWESLPRNKGCRIVVTTRFKSVANACCPKEEDIHMLTPLSHEESKILFFDTTHDPEPRQFIQTKEEIIKKCGGLPLAILTVAGLLSRRDLEEESQWKTVKESLKTELDKNLHPEGVTQILNLCYSDLPPDQKNCLLYLSIFPKGCSINRKRLVRRWIAEGFIVEKEGKTVEEVADDTFNELISRNIVRPVAHNSNGKVKACQVHDMILEYIVFKSSEENFITLVGGHWLTPTPSNKVRRLSLHSNNPEDAKEKIENMNLSHVRSLTVFDNLHHVPSYSFKSGILQVLDLEGCKSLNTSLRDKICKMFHLKYLSLRRLYIKKLPSEIGKLQYLETLDIRETYVTELPLSIGRLQKLVHMLGGNKSSRLSLRFTEVIANMTSLQTLSGIEISKNPTGFGSMHNLIKLKKLSIYNLRDTDTNSRKYDDLLSAIEYLSGLSLKSLEIDDGFTGFLNSIDDLSAPPKYILSLNLSGKLLHVPKWISHLETLEKLTLSLTSLSTYCLDIISELSLLFSLTFSITAKGQDHIIVEILQDNTLESGGKIYVPVGGFVSLKLLKFSAPVIPPLIFPEGAMPKLQRLEIQFRQLECAYGLENLASLQQVHLRVSQQASEDAIEKVSDIRSSVIMHPNKPTVVVDEYYE